MFNTILSYLSLNGEQYFTTPSIISDLLKYYPKNDLLLYLKKNNPNYFTNLVQ